MKTIKHLYVAWTNPYFKPTAIRVALVVGTVLFVLNHGSALITGQMSQERWVSGLATYLVPYTVSIHGQHVARCKQHNLIKKP